jgi:glycosyltransferase involved in cell wall biosynthesis
VYDGVPVLEEGHGDLIVTPANEHDPQKGLPLAAEAAALAGVKLTASTDLSRDLLHARLFIYVTHAEGLGSAALLAMSAGVPAIASKIGGLPEIVRHRETGLIVENNAAAIAEAIRELLADPEFAKRLGAEGRRSVRERFTVDHMVRRTMEVYRQVLV